MCCKEVGKDKKQNRAIGVGRPRQGKKRTMLQLKGRIFMQNVTDVISLAKGGKFIHQPAKVVAQRFFLLTVDYRVVYSTDILERRSWC